MFVMFWLRTVDICSSMSPIRTIARMQAQVTTMAMSSTDARILVRTRRSVNQRARTLPVCAVSAEDIGELPGPSEEGVIPLSSDFSGG